MYGAQSAEERQRIQREHQEELRRRMHDQGMEMPGQGQRKRTE
jgi:hypothetical protein